MSKRLSTLMLLMLALTSVFAQNNRTYNQVDENGTFTQRNEGDNGNFNKHNNDTTRHKEIPKGFHVWNIDRRLGDIIPTEPDTLAHLFPNTTLNSGFYKDYNTTGSNYTPRQSRIFADREDINYFFFAQPYSFVNKHVDDFLFFNTLSPYTSVLYDNCGNKQNGEDHIDAMFTINANKRLNFGFDLDYTYARGYYDNQGISHFNATLFSSYRGDKYQMHFFFNTAHQKASENGGITNDEYVTHPESFQQSFSENEIPTVLASNWNRNDHQHVFLSHRYNLGFYRKVKMTEEEIKARQFAEASRKEHEANGNNNDQNANRRGGRDDRNNRPNNAPQPPSGRPDGARVMGKEPVRDSLNIAPDSTRIQVDGLAALDSLNRAKAIQDSIDATMKNEYVPVTSFIHTFELNNYRRIYQSYATPTDYYKNTYYTQGTKYGNDSIYDVTRHLQIKNTLGLALLEGFNKYVKAGLKAFVSFDHCDYELPDTIGGVTAMNKWTENDISIGAVLSKTQGKTLHFNAEVEAWMAGPNSGQLNLDFSTDVNFPLFGDTVQLAANAYLHRQSPAFFLNKYHSKHIWWDHDDMENEVKTRIEGIFSYPKTKTQLRVAMDNIKNYTYFGMSYDATTTGRTGMTAGVYQESDVLNVLMAQLKQDFRLGVLNWENVVTYQRSSKQSVLPLPTWNLFTNLYLKFRIAKVLDVELGADATYFTKYYAPDYCPALAQFAVQKNEDSRVELGGYPFVDVYANAKLKGVRFFIVMTNILNGSGNHMKFLAPHYPTNGSVIHFGVSWPFFN